MGRVERAARRELRRLPDDLRRSTLAETVLDLARRIDGDPGDMIMVPLSREMRMTWQDILARAPKEVADDVERFLERIATTDSSDAAH
jgi:hypothetical protein